MTDPLRLHFNERPDCLTQIDKDMPFDQRLWQYPDRAPLEASLAQINGVTPEQILCTNGGDEAIMILMRILNEGVDMILPLPAFSQYTWGIESWGLKPTILQPGTNLGIDEAATLAAVAAYPETSTNLARPAAVVILTSPNNPTGQQLSNAYLAKLIQCASERNIWVFLDEAYIEFSQVGSDSAKWLAEYEHLVVLKTLSKAYGLAGIRLGYILGNSMVIAEFSRRCAPFNLPTPTLAIAEKALAEEIRDEVKSYCKTIQQNRAKLYDWLVENDIPVINGEANFLILPLGEQRAKMVARFLARQNILVRQFGGDLSHCVRITIPYNMDALENGLAQLFTPELVCLDMDGVLIDTSDSYDSTIKATIEQIAGESIAFEQIQAKRNAGGYNNDWVLTKALLDDMGIERSLDEVTEAFQALYLGTYVNNEKPLVNADFASQVVTSEKPKFAIVTGRPLAEGKAGKALVNLLDLDLISMDCAPPKPAPDGIMRLQKQYGSRSWMCGDNPDDIQAAHASGSVAIGIRATDQQALYDAGADIVVASVNELEQWL
jgi:histidinol-phosphate aminotransferase